MIINKYMRLLSIIFVLMTMNVTSLNAAIDNKGKDFIFTFIPNYNLGGNVIRLFITSDVDTSGVVEVPGLNISNSFNVTANEITTVELPKSSSLLPIDVISLLGIHVVAEDEVTVYGLNRDSATTDAFLALPADTLGLSYIVTAYAGISNYNLPSEVGIVGLYDNTEVTITPSVAISGSHPAGQAYTITLGNMETFLLSSVSGGDLTGTEITSTAPVGVSSGSKCSFVPNGVWACDHLVEMTPPTTTWGKTFLTVPLATRKNGDLLRIVAAENNTSVVINGTDVAMLSRGEHYDTITKIVSEITTSKPAQVSQYSLGQSYDGVVSDPFMMLIPPYEQYLKDYTFSTLGSEFNIARNYVNVIIETEAISSLQLNSESVDSSLFEAIGTSGFSGAKIPVSAGSHHIKADQTFGIFVYGFGSYESYGYPGGMAFDLINPAGDSYIPNLKLAQVGDVIFGITSDNEDINLNGELDLGEDLNDNNITDFRTEDLNGNGVLDDGEDNNSNGILDKDTGILKVELEDGATNLLLELSDFVPGQESVSFTIKAVNPDLLGKGFVLVSDAAGNVKREEVNFLSKFKDIKLRSIISTTNIDLNNSSFLISPTKTEVLTDRTILEWEVESFDANQTENFDFTLSLKDPKPGETRAVTYALELVYTDMEGTEINVALGQQDVKVLTPSADILVSTDKSIYDANMPVVFQMQVFNGLDADYDLTVKLQVEDLAGNIVKAFDATRLGVLQKDENTTVTNAWNTGVVIANNYKVHARLFDTNDNLVDEAYSSFSVSDTTGTGSAITASLRTTTDKPVYHTTDTLVINNLTQNLAINRVIEEAVLNIVLMDPSGTQIYAENISLGSLVPSAQRQFPLSLPFVGVAEGVYTINASLLGESATVLATSSTTCEVKENITKALLGQVTAQLNPVERGTTQVCSASVTHNGNVNISNLNLRQLLVSADTEQEVGIKTVTTSIQATQTYSFAYNIETYPMIEGDYLCILQAQINGAWETLAHDTYTLVRPPIQIDSMIQTGTHGPLLVLLDSPNEYGWCLGIFATGFHGHDPYGPYDAPLLVEQRAYLENLLTAHGYNYTIVDNENDFKRELRTGNYSTYALFNEYVNMSSQTLSEIREAVYLGDGLLFAGKHQYFNDELQRPLGLDFNNMHDHVTKMTLIDTAEYSPSTISLVFEDEATRFKLKGAEALGSFEIKSSLFNFCPDDEKYSLTRNKYNNGRGVFAAFDLLMQAATPGAPVEVERILLEALDDIQPDVYNANLGSVYPMHISMINKQIATQGYTQTRITGASIINAGKGTVDDDNVLNWRFNLSEGGSDSLDYWIKIPPSSAHVDIETSIYAGETGIENFYESITHTIAVDTSTYFSLQDALDASNAIGSWSLNSVEYQLGKAIYYENKADYAHALSHAINAADELSSMSGSDRDQIRSKLAHAIRALSAKI